MKGNNTNSQAIPSTMRALELRAYDGKPESLVLVKKPVPRPRAGEVLVQISAAPINPSDLMFLRGLYANPKKLPVVAGFEGSGTVVASGGGFIGRMLVGKHVACAAPYNGDGAWSEYMVTSEKFCIPLRRGISLEQGATFIVNPLSAWALMDVAKRGRHRALVQSAAASALGRMLLRLGHRFNIPIIHLVRRQEQVELLQALGAKHVLNSSEPEFDDTLKRLSHDLHATLAFDAIAGEMTGRILRAMPKGGRAIVYGALSGQACQIDPRSLIFEGKQAEGFWLPEWMQQRNMLSRMRAAMQAQKFLASDLKTEVRARLPLEEAVKGLQQYAADMTEGKILLIPNKNSAN